MQSLDCLGIALTVCACFRGSYLDYKAETDSLARDEGKNMEERKKMEKYVKHTCFAEICVYALNYCT